MSALFVAFYYFSPIHLGERFCLVQRFRRSKSVSIRALGTCLRYAFDLSLGFYYLKYQTRLTSGGLAAALLCVCLAIMCMCPRRRFHKRKSKMEDTQTF